jgi:hypothetical protein
MLMKLTPGSHCKKYSKIVETNRIVNANSFFSDVQVLSFFWNFKMIILILKSKILMINKLLKMFKTFLQSSLKSIFLI